MSKKQIKSAMIQYKWQNWKMSQYEFNRQLREGIIKDSVLRFTKFTHTQYEYLSHLNWGEVPEDVRERLVENDKNIQRLKELL